MAIKQMAFTENTALYSAFACIYIQWSNCCFTIFKFNSYRFKLRSLNELSIMSEL